MVEKSLSFPDIPDDFWAANEIAYMTSRGYLAGKLDGTYNSTEALTRGMVALVLWRLAGQPEPQLGDVQVFPDVKTGTRYSKAIAWAAQEGVKVVSGYPDGTFRPDAPITRLHLTAMLDRYMTNVAGYALPEDASKDVTQFNDYDRISQSLVDSANWAYRTGILAGRTGNLFDPNGNASRGQMAVIMCRLMQKYNICLTEDMIAQVTQ